MSEENTVVLRDRLIKEPKEIGEIFDAFEGLVKAIKDGATRPDKIALATAQLPALVVAVDGFDKVSNEAKDKNFFQAVGAFVGRLTGIFV